MRFRTKTGTTGKTAATVKKKNNKNTRNKEEEKNIGKHSICGHICVCQCMPVIVCVCVYCNTPIYNIFFFVLTKVEEEQNAGSSVPWLINNHKMPLSCACLVRHRRHRRMGTHKKKRNV